jgi:uncharacterized membrane protein YdjX (TVP38/TMEM64 family)
METETAMDEAHVQEERRTIAQTLALVVRSPFFWQMVALVSVSVACKLWLESQSDPGRTIRAMGILAPLFSLALHSTTAMTPVGSSVIPTLNGMLFPLLLAIALNLTGGMVGNIGMYYVWRRGDREFQIQKRMRMLPLRAQRFARTDLPSLIVMRLFPWAGGNLSTFLAGAYHLPLRVQVVSVLVGALPGSIIYALLGAGIVAL